MTRSLSARLVGAALVWLALLLGAGGASLSYAFRDTVEREFEHRLEALQRALVAALTVDGDGGITVTRSLGEPRFEQIYSGWYWQVQEDGRLVRSRSLWDFTLPVHDGAAGNHRVVGPDGRPLMAIERDITVPERDQPLHVTVAGDLAEVEREVHRFSLLLGVSLGLLGAGLLVALVIQVRFGLRPLRRLAADLDQVRAGGHDRLSADYPREVTPLVAAMNALLDHDADIISRARTHVGNLAHGLKTPLSVLRAELQAGPDADREVMAEQLRQMERLIGHHLGRAASVAPTRAGGTRVELVGLLSELRNALLRIHADKALALELDVAADAAIVGEREDIEELLGNLVDNACKWARRRVTVAAHGDGQDLVLMVEDDGPGLSPEEADQAARRGARFDEQTPGWGLGLAIVADLVALHGGRLDFGRSPLGGLRVTVRLPG
jgi:signal transduction histidine kinase